MRVSCNGCRVLRKGCSDACTIRPCLQWIATPEAQAHATVFLAKFYGRAGLLNLLAAAAPGGGAAVFRSLLYEACGRIVNPAYGSVGLLWSGQWRACQDAVEAVLRGEPLAVVAPDEDAPPPPPLAAAYCDIRHVAKDPDAAAAADLLRVARGRTRFKRAAASSLSKLPSNGCKKRASSSATDGPPALRRRNRKQQQQQQDPEPEVVQQEPEPMVTERHQVLVVGPAASSHGDEESAGSHDHHRLQQGSSSEEDTDVEAGSHSHVSQAEAENELRNRPCSPASSSQMLLVADHEEVGLELTLGFQPVVVRQQQQQQTRSSSRCDWDLECDQSGLSAAASGLIGLRLQLPAA